MIRGLTRPRRLLTGAVLACGLAVAATGTAMAGGWDGWGHGVPAPPANPTRADQIQNIDQVKTAIKAYYGDTPQAATDPVTGQPTTLHYASPTSAYAKEMAGIVGQAERYLGSQGHGHGKHSQGAKAIVLDVDDTTLNTYDYEIYSNFVYNPTQNAAFVNGGAFPAVFHMPDLVKYAQSKGYAILFLTGRPETQRAGTVANLTAQGYPSVPANQIILKDYTADTWLSSCAPSCTTTQYKTLSRQHFQSLGFHIVANFGDQYSDLNGGVSDRTFKIPNPMYYLP